MSDPFDDWLMHEPQTPLRYCEKHDFEYQAICFACYDEAQERAEEREREERHEAP